MQDFSHMCRNSCLAKEKKAKAEISDNENWKTVYFRSSKYNEFFFRDAWIYPDPGNQHRFRKFAIQKRLK